MFLVFRLVFVDCLADVVNVLRLAEYRLHRDSAGEVDVEQSFSADNRHGKAQTVIRPRTSAQAGNQCMKSIVV